MLKSCAAVKGPDAGVQSPELRFDPAQHQISGFTGCNRFFGRYELSGTVLQFNPLATTRWACPDAESTLEMNFLDALARTRGWKFEADALLLLDDGKVLARFVSKRAVPNTPALESLVFHSRVLPTSLVTLAQGVYRVPAAPGSASEITAQLTDQRVFGAVNDVKIGAAILITATGGSGTYRELALLSETAAGWVNTDTVLLGDRVQVQALAIEGDAIVISLMPHGPDDPQCCTT